MARSTDKDKIELSRRVKELPKELSIKQRRMLVSLKDTLDNVVKACKMANIARSTHYEWLHSSDIYKKEVEDVREGLLDKVESALLDNVFTGNVVAQIFYLKTKGKDRGYTEVIEHKIDDTAGINITINKKR